jgi:hypothetical protein
VVVRGRKLIKENQLQLFAGKYIASSTTKIVVQGTGETPSPILKKKETKKESNLSETQKRQLRKQLEAQKRSGEKAKTKIQDKISRGYETIGPSASDHMFKHYLEKDRCGSNHNLYNKRTHLINSNYPDLGTGVVRTVYYIQLDILHRNKRRTNLVKCNREAEIQTIQRIYRFAIHGKGKRPSMIKCWDNK